MFFRCRCFCFVFLIILITTGSVWGAEISLNKNQALAIASDTADTNINNEITRIVTPLVSKAKLGVYIKSLSEDKVLYRYASETPLIPASNEKVVTTVAAYHLLGPDYRFRTELYMDKRMLIVGDRYFGDLAVKGYGDPLLNQISLVEIIDNSPLKKVKKIYGQLYIDDTAFDSERFGQDWHDRFVKEIGAIILRDFSLMSPGSSAKTLPANLGVMIQKLLQALQIKQDGKIIVSRAVPATMKLVAAKESKTLLEIMSIGNKESDNSILEQIFKSISENRLGIGTTSGSEYLIKKFYSHEIGLDPTKYEIRDGSGLSRKNSISAYYLAKILEYAYYHPYVNNVTTVSEINELALNGKHPYMNTLSIAGQDGTLKKRLQGMCVYGKTGTLSLVDSLSGYLVTASGKIIVFSMIVNDFKISRQEVKDVEDKILKWIFENY